MNFLEFLNMGGYAFYVWSSWGITTVVLGFIVMQSYRGNAKIIAQIKRQLRRQQNPVNR